MRARRNHARRAREQDAAEARIEEPMVEATPDPVSPDVLETVPSGELAPEAGVGEEPEVARRSHFARHVRRRSSGRLPRVWTQSAPPSTRRATLGGRVVAGAGRALRTAVTVVLIGALLVGALFGLALGINGLARWNARRLAAGAVKTAASENLLVIGVRDGAAIGFTALKIERSNKRVLGIAIPDGAFVEVPGRGFERIGESYVAGPTVSEAAVSNYFAVPFRNYVVIDGDTYQGLLQNQDIGLITDKIQATDLTASARASVATFLKSVGVKNVWIVPLPVKAMTVGTERYYEPQRAQVADLLLQWWGVRLDQQKARPRVIVYNGVGTPGLASQAAQQLIRRGFQIVDSGNADHFGYVETTILVYHAPTEATAVRDALGVGVVKMQSAPQELTDMIVIVGADYLPPVSDTSTDTTEGAR